MSTDTPQFKKPFERLTNVDESKVMPVIQVKSLIGEGDGEGTPKRQITEYFSLEGERLARVDEFLNGELKEGIWSKNE